jgi:hypothetical protein
LSTVQRVPILQLTPVCGYAQILYTGSRRFVCATSQEALQTANAWYAVGVYDNETAPSGLTATIVSDTQVNLAWTDNATNETAYVIERSLRPAKILPR